MTDLTDWLAAVHAADERAARTVIARNRDAAWHVPPPPTPDEDGIAEYDDPMVRDSRGLWLFAIGDGHLDRNLADYIARNDPQATVARIEAERQVCRLHGPNHEWAEQADDWVYCLTCVVDHDNVLYPCPTLRALAWGYRGRDGWRAEWAPDGVGVGA